MRPPSATPFSLPSLLRCFGALSLAAATFPLPRPASAQIAPSAAKQIQEIYAFKASLSPAEQKMSSNLQRPWHMTAKAASRSR